ncbi:MAG TPA: DNA recombination protein RmuC, partial [Saprospiraceae bacterium]|nr:DNA recombination protein RmuC [Saprospiraceae bacterium]
MDNHYLLILLGVVFIFTLVIFKLLLDKNWTTKIQSGFVPKDQYNQLNHSLTEKESVISALDQSLNALRIDITLKEEQLRSQDEMIDYKMREIEGIRETTRKEFELLAQKIFEEKSSRFTETNKANIEILLKPLKENIQQFESRIHQQFTEEFKSRSELKKEIELLKTHSDQMSREANNLAVAIKGDKKLLGDWGEIQLETILQHSGLEKNVHYKVQMSIKDEEGNDKRPDFVVFLPDEKCIIIDSKVSLVAYEKYFNADTDDERQKFLKQHIQDVRNHIKGLATKSYQSLPGLQNPEYVLLFIPLEPAFNVVVQYDSRIFMEALDQNIVLVTSTTLMATMRTVYHIWR